MYGLVHDAIEKLIISLYGVEKWNEIKTKAQCPVDETTGSWTLTQIYGDQTTLDIVGAACGILELSVEQLVETLGGYFIVYARVRGFDNILRSMGSDLFSWLQSVNDLHVHLRTALNKDLLFPEIYCAKDADQDTATSFVLHYRSVRGSLLAPLVVGIVKKAADIYFMSAVTLDRLATQGEEGSEFTTWRVTITGSTEMSLDHRALDDDGNVDEHVPVPVFLNVSAAASQEKKHDEMQRLALLAAKSGGGCPFTGRGGEVLSKRKEVDEVSAAFGLSADASMSEDTRPAPLLSSQRTASQRLHTLSSRLSSRSLHSQQSFRSDQPLSGRDTTDSALSAAGPEGLSGPQLMDIFPFHIGLDRDFNVVQYGSRLELVVPQVELNTPIGRYLRLAFPKCGWTWKDLDPCKDASFEIDVYVDAGGASEGGTGAGEEGTETGAATGAEGSGAERAVAGYRLVGGLYLLRDGEQDRGDDESVDMIAASARASTTAQTARPFSTSASASASATASGYASGSNEGRLYAVLLVEPNLQSIASLVTHGLTWSDFPRHSSQQRLIILAEQLRSEQNKQTKAQADERDSRKKEFVDTVFSLELLVANDFSVWFYIIQLTDIDGVEQRVKEYVAAHPELARAQDTHGRTAISVASKSNKEAMQAVLLWHGRYALTEDRPEHASSTCFVYKAVDELRKDEFGHPIRVAIKLMRQKEQYMREMQSRKKGFHPDCVIEMLASYPEAGSEALGLMPAEVDTAGWGPKLTKQQAESMYCVVMPFAERNLYVALKHEVLNGTDLDQVRHVLVQLARCVEHIHAKGLLHGDIKPLNIVRMGAQWKLIDLDAACHINEEAAGQNTSTAFMPPEAVAVDAAGGVYIRNGAGELAHARSHPDLSSLESLALETAHQAVRAEDVLIAHPSYDIWSLACVLYQLCTDNKPLFVGGHNDALTDDRSEEDNLYALHEWSAELKQKKLAKVGDALARNLLAQMLQKDPTTRPSLTRIFAHPFLTGKKVARLVGDKPLYDVFLSYRVASDGADTPLKHVEKLYNLLVAQGLVVYWDRMCLKPGVSWEAGFCEGLVTSRAFVPLLSREAINHPDKDRQSFARLTADSPCDNMYLEQRLAMELHGLGLIEKVFPVMIGDYDAPRGTYGDYLQDGCHPRMTHDVVVRSVEVKLCHHLDSQALGTPLQPDRTVGSVVGGILGYQGAFIKGSADEAFAAASASIVHMLQGSPS